MDHEILIWLNSDRNYFSGILLYDRYGRNPNLGRILRVGGATGKNRLTLLYELGKIAKHLAVCDNTPALEKPQVKQDIQKQFQAASATRPPALKNLRSEQKMCYKMLDNLHAILPYREIQERKDIAFQILELDDRLMEITQRIDHYEKHGVIPPAPVKDEPKKVSDLNDAELIQRQNERSHLYHQVQTPGGRFKGTEDNVQEPENTWRSINWNWMTSTERLG